VFGAKTAVYPPAGLWTIMLELMYVPLMMFDPAGAWCKWWC